MRIFVAVLTGILAAGLSVALLPTAWLDQHVSDRDGFIVWGTEIAQDSEFRIALSDTIATTSVKKLDLPEALARPLQKQLKKTVRKLFDSPKFDAAWQKSLTASHYRMFDPAGPQQASLDITPLAVAAVKEVDNGLAQRLGDASFHIKLGGQEADTAVQRAQYLRTVMWMLIIAVGGCAIIAIAGARSRGRALVWLGIGAVVSAAVQWLGVVPFLLNRATNAATPATTELFRAASDAALDSYRDWIISFGGAGLAIAVLGAIIAVVLRD